MCTDSLCNPIELRKQGLKTKRKTSGRLADVPPLSTSKTTDNWPAENDRAVLVSLCAEVPLLDHTLMRLGVLGITPNLPLRSQDVLDIINRVVGCTSHLVSAFQLKRQTVKIKQYSNYLFSHFSPFLKTRCGEQLCWTQKVI